MASARRANGPNELKIAVRNPHEYRVLEGGGQF